MKRNKKVEQAREVATLYHQGQKYGEYDYLYHLDQVAKIAIDLKLPSDYVVACYLHDIVEDTSCTLKEIKEAFGEDVLNMVYACTDEVGRDRTERKKKTYEKLYTIQSGVVVKVCDRIANCRFSAKNSKSKALMYLEEDALFRTIHSESPFWYFDDTLNIVGKYKKLWEIYGDAIAEIRLSLTQ